MLPEDCRECEVCGMPTMSHGICDACEISAANRLGLDITKDERGYLNFTDPKSGKDAYWRVAGLLANWAKSVRIGRL